MEASSSLLGQENKKKKQKRPRHLDFGIVRVQAQLSIRHEQNKAFYRYICGDDSTSRTPRQALP